MPRKKDDRSFSERRGVKEVEHGKRGRYVQGCRCEPCTKANREYARSRYLAKCRGEGDPLVPAWRARRKLKKLSDAGVGTRTISDVTGIARSTLQALISGRKKKCRKSTLGRLNAMTIQAWADGQLVDAAPTWELLNELIVCGWSKAELARRLGSKAKQSRLQIRSDKVLARTELKVKKLYEKLRYQQPPLRKTRRGLREPRASVPATTDST